MKAILELYLREKHRLDNDWANWIYSENINKDALSDDWLENRTSYIYKVGVLAAIDANKCDWVHIAIGIQVESKSAVQVIGEWTFPDGENTDISRVINRSMSLLQGMGIGVFEDININQ